jgi:hypothetical protein
MCATNIAVRHRFRARPRFIVHTASTQRATRRLGRYKNQPLWGFAPFVAWNMNHDFLGEV